MFLIALAGSAFSQHSKAAQKKQMLAWYYDPNWNVCYETEIDNDGQCMSDNLGFVCEQYIGGLGYQYMFQAGFGSTCYAPYYSYVPSR